MPNKRLLIAAAVVLALILACAGSYLFWPRARDWADMQFDNIVRHHDNASRFGAANDALETTTIRHWVDDCDKSLTIVGLCYGAYDAFNVIHGASRSIVNGTSHCQDEAGYRPEIARKHIRNYLAWFKAHRGYYGFSILDAFVAVTPSTGDSCYMDPRAPEHES